MTKTPEYPTVGCAVHQVGRGSADGAYPPVCRAATVTAAPRTPPPDGALDLFVTPPDGTFHARDVPYHPGVPADTDGPTRTGALCASGELVYPGGTWHWPERAERA